MPTHVMPMLATLTNEPFNDAGWLFEIKWDGYRSIARVEKEEVELVSRNKLSFTEKFSPVTQALRDMQIGAIFDGEIVAVNEKGIAVFQSLQNWQNTPVQLQYFIFDIIWLEGRDLTHIPLIERKDILKKVLPENHDVIKFSDHVTEKGKDFFKVALTQGLEGIMAKKTSSLYMGGRSKDWLKIKVNQRQEVIIAGYTEPRNSRKYFGSLLLGLYEGDDLVYIGHTGGGFDTKTLSEVYQQLQPLVITKSPFIKIPKTNMPATWVKPVLVCEIKFTEWTQDRIARHPIFMGMRMDKKPKDVIFEKMQHMATTKNKAGKKNNHAEKKTVPSKSAGSSIKGKVISSKKSVTAPKENKVSPRKTGRGKKQMDTNSVEMDSSLNKKDQELKINGHVLKLTNLNKIYWKQEKFTKGDMVRYYMDIAPFMLPYMKDRPQSLNRHPNGIDGLNFYQKDVAGKVPGWMKTHTDFSESTNQHVEYLVCSNEATLVYMANMGCIEMHPWHSRTKTWEQPDWCLIDLDPDTKNSFDQVIDVANVVKKLLDSIGVDAVCKTSGSSGIHIYIPLGAKYSYDQSKQLAELIVTLVNHELPGITSLERSPAKRKGKLYLDYLQNRQTQTAAAPYSLRPKPGVPVSTPLHWSEVKKGLTPTTYHARNIFERLKTEGDLFQPVLGKGINLELVLKKLATQMK